MSTVGLCIALVALLTSVAQGQEIQDGIFRYQKHRLEFRAPDGFPLKIVSLGDRVCQTFREDLILEARLEIRKATESPEQAIDEFVEVIKELAQGVQFVHRDAPSLGPGTTTRRVHIEGKMSLATHWVVTVTERDGWLYQVIVRGSDQNWEEARKRALALANGLTFTDLSAEGEEKSPEVAESRMTHEKAVRRLAFSGNGSVLVSCDSEKIRRWTSETGELTHEWDAFMGHEILVDETGDHLLVTAQKKGETIYLDIRVSEETSTLPWPRAAVIAPTWKKVLESSEKSVRVLDRDGKVIQTQKGPKAATVPWSGIRRVSGRPRA